ncbi:hypothetical protein D9757_012079 [Collybiopsis confluens]|uniref:Uncharacterized protein n=1 Tax=Collybiopsis confluens TaxID=2823264 RepID=A0A8H5LL50_9AGAR|nr:hypothetical protein D9757_012079 [Collybiopsis confluens]
MEDFIFEPGVTSTPPSGSNIPSSDWMNVPDDFVKADRSLPRAVRLCCQGTATSVSQEHLILPAFPILDHPDEPHGPRLPLALDCSIQIRNVARTQSSARTLARTRVVDDRTEYEDEEADPSIPPLPMTPIWLSALNRNGTRNLTASPASFTRGGGGGGGGGGSSVADAAGEVDQMLHHQILGSNPDPNRQTTNDSLPPPAYTGRTPTIDLPPPPPPLGIFPPTA